MEIYLTCPKEVNSSFNLNYDKCDLKTIINFLSYSYSVKYLTNKVIKSFMSLGPVASNSFIPDNINTILKYKQTFENLQHNLRVSFVHSSEYGLTSPLPSRFIHMIYIFKQAYPLICQQ